MAPVFVETGLWLRSAWFPQEGEDWFASASREVRNARERVGICDVSTLGKIDVQGKDAAAFLDRLYCNTFSTLTAGRARYGLMLREDGIAFDDGTTSRLAADHFLMTTTTANAARVMSHMEFCHQALWPDLDVTYISVTEQWAQMAVAGPKSRATLQKIVDGITLDDTTFPYLAAKDVKVPGGVPARLFRISFSGEHSYELAVPADYGSMTAHAILKAGEEFGIAPYGVEALSIMRIEKGHVAGSELNGTTTAADLGLGRMMSTKKDYIGRMMAAREGLTDKSRQCVVGIRPVAKSDRIRAGAHLEQERSTVDGQRPGLYLPRRIVADAGPMGRTGASCKWPRTPRQDGEDFRRAENIHVLSEICEPVITIAKIPSSMPKTSARWLPDPDRTAPRRSRVSPAPARFGAGRGLPGVELSVRHPTSIVTVIARRARLTISPSPSRNSAAAPSIGPGSISTTSSPTIEPRALCMMSSSVSSTAWLPFPIRNSRPYDHPHRRTKVA